MGPLPSHRPQGGGTYEYSINGGSTWGSTASFSGLAAGVYDIRIRDAATPTCARTLNATAALNNPTQLNATLGKTDPTTCAAPHNGSITLLVPAGGSGLYDFSIDGGTNWSTSATFNGLAAGNYDVRIRDRNNPVCAPSMPPLH